VPGTYDGQHGWNNMRDWQEYAHKMPNDVQLDIWADDWPDAGICVPMGGNSGLLGIDIDTDRKDIVDALERELGGCLIARRRGKRGYCAFVLAPEGFGLKQSKWNVDGMRVLDLLHTGRQVVMPPTIHPDTHQAYEWQTPFKAYNLDELPPCPADIVERCQRAIEPFQSADDKRKQADDLQRSAHVVNESDELGRRLNDAALADVAAWLYDIVPENYRKYVKWGDTHRVVPFWRGVTDSDKVGITRHGIRDFAENRGYTPIDLVMAIRGCGVHTAMEYLGEKLGIIVVPEKVEVGGDFAKTIDEVKAELAAEKRARDAASMAGTSVPVKVVVDDGVTVLRPIAKESVIVDEGIPNELLKPPGIMADIFRWMLATAQQPLPEMSLHATIAFCSMMARQIYVGPTGSRSNLNLIGIARSGFGKAHPQECLMRLLAHCGQERVLGGSKIASGQAIVSMLSDGATGSAAIYVLDEVDGLLRAALGVNAQAHIREITDQMMSLYSASSNPLYKGTDYANRKEKRSEALAYPHLTVIGFTTPDKFWSNVKGADVASGFINRLMVAQAPDAKPKANVNRASLADMPNGLKLWSDSVRNPGYAVDGAQSLGATPSNPVQVEYEDTLSQQVLESFQVEVDEQRDKMHAQGRGLDDALVRWYENAHKLALIAAVAKHPVRPVIDEECARWAVGYVRWCGRIVVAGVENRVFESEFDESVQRVHQYVLKQGERGVVPSRLVSDCRALRRLTEPMAKQVLDRLVKMGRIELREVTRASGKKATVWVAVESATDGDD
jgi:hypothetical protein